jgi:sugar phosphate permease
VTRAKPAGTSLLYCYPELSYEHLQPELFIPMRWRIFGILAFLYLLAYFYRVSMAVLAGDLARDLDLNAMQLGTLSGAFFYAFAFAQLPMGPFLDRYGGKRVILLTGISTTFGVLLFSHASTYYSALAGRIFIGLGSASVLMGALQIFTNWFDKQEFGKISGFIIAVGNLGNIAATAPLAWAAGNLGWRYPFNCMAVLQALSLLLTLCFVHERPGSPHSVKGSQRQPFFSGLKVVFSSPSYWYMSFLAFSWYASYMAVQGLWGGPYLVDCFYLSKESAGNILFFISLGFLCGCSVIGNVTDRLIRSPKRTLLFGQVAQVIFISLFLGGFERLNPFFLKPVFFAFGLTVSSGVAIYPLIRESFPVQITGTALTAVNFFILLGAASMQHAMGAIIGIFPYNASGTTHPPSAYHTAFILPVIFLVASIILFTKVKETRLA